jgi:hypothetical protein
MQATTGKAGNASAESKTPNKDAFFDRMDEVMERWHVAGSCLIRGIKAESEEDEIEGKEMSEDLSVYQLSTLRYAMMPSARETALRKADDFATCGQSNRSLKMYTTTSGNQVIAGIPKELAKINKKKALPERFDGLFALTFAVERNKF